MENGEFRIRVPKDVLKCIVMKGSVAVNGVSLTVSKRAKDSFSIALIPHTLVHTNLGELKEGGVVNIETDMLARQIVAFIGKKA